MKFVNLKTCHGLESYIQWNGSLLRLSLLPELLRSLPRREATELVESLLTEMVPEKIFLPITETLELETSVP